MRERETQRRREKQKNQNSSYAAIGSKRNLRLQ